MDLSPLNTYFNDQRGDHFTTATDAGRRRAAAAGYTFVRAEGWVEATPDPLLVPLKSFWHQGRQDNFLCTTAAGAQAAAAVGYQLTSIEGYISLGNPEPHARLKLWWSGTPRFDNLTTSGELATVPTATREYAFVREEGPLEPPHFEGPEVRVR